VIVFSFEGFDSYNKIDHSLNLTTTDSLVHPISSDFSLVKHLSIGGNASSS